MKQKVLTVTLNPAIDRTCTIGDMVCGSVNRLQSTCSYAGGKGINVTKILRQYEYEVTATGVLGGYSGRFIEDKMKEAGAFCQFLHIEGETRTNTNIVSETGSVTEILEPGPVVDAVMEGDFIALYRQLLPDVALVVLSGSAVCGFQSDIYYRLTKEAHKHGVAVFLDTSGEWLQMGVKAKPDLIKPNKKELETLVGYELRSINEVITEAVKLQKGGIARVMVSLGEDGLLGVSKYGIMLGKSEKIEAKNTVGCGDSVMASLAMSFIRQDNETEALRTATAIAAANATTLESAVIPMDTVNSLREGVQITIW